MPTFRRRVIREKVLQALYAYEISKEPITSVVNYVFGELKEHRSEFDFAKKLLAEVVHHENDVDRLIRGKVAHWEYERIALIDRLLLRIGVCEFLYFPDIPPKVTLNELIEIGKIFSTEQSGKFLNGVLDAILEELRQNNRLYKTGRGLIEDSIHEGHAEPKSPAPTD